MWLLETLYFICVFYLFSNQNLHQEGTGHASFLNTGKNEEKGKSNTSSVIIGVSVTIIILLAVAGIGIYFKVSTNFISRLYYFYTCLLNSVAIVSCEVEILKGCACTEAATMGVRTKR